MTREEKAAVKAFAAHYANPAPISATPPEVQAWWEQSGELARKLFPWASDPDRADYLMSVALRYAYLLLARERNDG